MLVHDFRHDGKTEPHAGFLGGHKRIEYLLAEFTGNPRTGVGDPHFDAVAPVTHRASDGNAQRATAGFTHGLIGILRQIDEALLGKTLIQGNRREILFVVPLHLDRRAAPIRSHGLERQIDDGGQRLRPEFETQGPREIEKAGHQSAQPIHFRRNVARQLGGERLGGLEPLGQHLGRTLDDAERVANFVGQTGGELPERGQAFRAAGFGLREFQAAIGFGQFLRQSLVAQRLPPIFRGKAIDDHRRQKEKQDANGEFGVTTFR